MTPNERDSVMARLLGIWPTPTMHDAPRMIWNEFLEPLDGVRALKALKTLQRTNARRPAQSEFWEAYLAEQGSGKLLSRPPCVVCEDGWVGFDTVQRCPNGCMPPSREEREERRKAEDRAWFAARALERKGSGEVRA